MLTSAPVHYLPAGQAAAEPTQITLALERLALLVPEIPPSDSRDLLAYALAYVGRYRGDVLQLEHEWEVLCVAVEHAWQRGADAAVVRLVTALAYPAGRWPHPASAEHILQRGIAASHRTQDQPHRALFLNRLGGLLFAQGQYQQGQQVWHAGLALGAAAGGQRGLWDPFASVVHIADILNNYTSAQAFAETYQGAATGVDSETLAVVIFIRAFYARLTEDLDQATADLRDCLRLLAHPPANSSPSAYRQLFTMLVQAELARAQSQYARAQAYTETALGLAQVFSDPTTVMNLLIDQLFFTVQHKQFTDAQILFRRVSRVAEQSTLPHLVVRSHQLGQRLAGGLLASADPPDWVVPIPGAQMARPALSARELEVLRFVAAGLSNREIAERLVVTAGTVKKHLEHIYTKLDVPSRTAALTQARALKILR